MSKGGSHVVDVGYAARSFTSGMAYHLSALEIRARYAGRSPERVW